MIRAALRTEGAEPASIEDQRAPLVGRSQEGSRERQREDLHMRKSSRKDK